MVRKYLNTVCTLTMKSCLKQIKTNYKYESWKIRHDMNSGRFLWDWETIDLAIGKIIIVILFDKIINCSKITNHVTQLQCVLSVLYKYFIWNCSYQIIYFTCSKILHLNTMQNHKTYQRWQPTFTMDLLHFLYSLFACLFVCFLSECKN